MNAALEASTSNLASYDTEQAWYGPDVKDSDDWIHVLNPEQIAELDAAILAPEKQGRDILTLPRYCLMDFIARVGEKSPPARSRMHRVPFLPH